jgi:hypothetical protein
VLTSRYCIRWRRLREEAVARRRCKGGGGLWSSWEGRRWLCVCCVEVRRSGEPSVPFIGGKRRFGRGIFSPARSPASSGGFAMARPVNLSRDSAGD